MSSLEQRLEDFRAQPSTALDLSQTQAGPHLAARLRTLNGHDRIEELILDDTALGDSGTLALAESLELPGLKRLSLRFNGIGHDGMRAMLSAPWMAHIVELDLSGNRVDNNEIALLAESPPAQLSRLHLSGNIFCPHGVHMLADSGLELEELSMYRCTVNNDGLRSLSQSPSMSKLRQLILAHTEIDDLGAHALAESPHIQRLEVLDLGQNNLSEPGIVALVRSSQMRGLKHLDFSGNDITSASLIALANSELDQLEILELGGSYLMGGGAGTPEAFSALAASPALRNLRVLGIAGHLCGDAGAQAVAEGDWPKLERLDLRMNELGDHGALALAACMGLSKLVFLDLRVNKIGDEGARAIGQARHWMGLRLLLLDNNQISGSGARFLAEETPDHVEGVGLTQNPIDAFDVSFLKSAAQRIFL